MKKKLWFGALAGTLGGLAMKSVVRFLDPASFGLSARTDAKTVHELCRRMDWKPIGEEKAARIGSAMHYGFAVGAAALYAAGTNEFPMLRAGRGAVFGAALWLLGDEFAVSVSGLEDPRQAPVFSHFSALGAHVLYGIVVDAVQGMAG